MTAMMKRKMSGWSVLAGLSCLAAATAFGAPEQNLLTNPGFESEKGWRDGWTIENVAGKLPPYVYHLTANGGGHGPAVPHTGANAIEIYSSDRTTVLSQVVDLEPGTYRLAVWARHNKAPYDPQLEFAIGDQKAVVPVHSCRYRQYYADFKIATAGKQKVSFQSPCEGMALDDASLVRVEPNDTNEIPYLYFDLIPTGEERSAGIQYYIRGQRQWVNFGISVEDPKRLGTPSMRVIAPPTVLISGFNVDLLTRWKPQGAETPSLQEGIEMRDGKSFNVFTVLLPRFVYGTSKPMEFGGFWVEVPSGVQEKIAIELVDKDQTMSREELTLVPVDPPARQVTPRLVRTIPYCVCNWMQSPAESLATVPSQFHMMGFNVWSEYFMAGRSPSRTPSPVELAQDKAARDYGVTEFWPNYSQLLDTGKDIGGWNELSGSATDKDIYVVDAKGAVKNSLYNMRYAAASGKLWLDSAVAAHKLTLSRPKDIGLSYSNTGFITDALEFTVVSYDPTTLDEFAAQSGIPRAEATPANLNGRYARQWTSYNLSLYNGVCAAFSAGLKAAFPDLHLGNTAGAFGPGEARSLPIPEQTEWTKYFDVTMPQWYAQNFYGDAYYTELMQGAREKLYGKENGRADLIPLFHTSMNADLNDPQALRFMAFDFLSATPVVTGIGYYIGTYCFADGKFMVGLSEAHTLLADVEDYYMAGKPVQGAATFEHRPDGPSAVTGLKPDGQQVKIAPKVETSVRVHLLGKDGRMALLTIISHCNHGVGEKGTVRINFNKLGIDEAQCVLVDHLAKNILPLARNIVVDTRATGNMALLEIVEKSRAEELQRNGLLKESLTAHGQD